METSSRYCDGGQDSQSGVRRQRQTGGRKRLRILVVHDFDLKSTAKLAGSSLLSSNNIRTHKRRSSDPLLERSVDLCIAVNSADSSTFDGLYDLNDELLPYYQGPARRNRMLKAVSKNNRLPQNAYTYMYNGTEVRNLRGRPRIGKKVLSTSVRSIPVPVPLPPASQPTFFRDDDDGNIICDCGIDYGGSMGVEDDSAPLDSSSGVSPEERAARRGLVTAALSQLESIVCRVAYMLKEESDSEKTDDHEHLRLTSNSLDVQNRWLPLVEGLGLAGHLEENEQGTGFGTQSLEALLRSAHPLPSDEQTMEAYRANDPNEPLFQSIVITASRAENTIVEKSEATSRPLQDTFVRDHLLLEIAAGAEAVPSLHSYSAEGNTTTTVITPGSLREKGEFCLVDLILDDDVVAKDSERPFRWRVEQTHFHQLESTLDVKDWA